MEVVLNGLSNQTMFNVGEMGEVAAVRRAGATLARLQGFNEVMAGKVSIVITEAGTNIVKHAVRGQILLRPVTANQMNGVEIVAIDKGPGMTNLSINMADGVSSTGTYGVGLGAMKRLAADFDVYTAPELGTVLHMTLWADEKFEDSTPWQIGAVSLPVDGETVCGDTWALTVHGKTLTLLVADGLGHGPEAATASRLIASVLDLEPGLPPGAALQAAHTLGKGTRGAAAALAQVDQGGAQLHFAGVGNIAACIVAADGSRQHMVSYNGIVGSNVRKVKEDVAGWSPAAVLIMHSDGIGTRWNFDSYPGLVARHPALIAAVIYRDFARPRDDLTVVVVRENKGH